MTRAGKVAVVTGAAGAIAGAILARLDARGFRTILLDLPGERLEAAARRLVHADRTVAVDLSTPDGIAAACRTVAADHGDVDLLVNCAGVIQVGDIADLDQAALDRHINVNLLAPMHLIRTVAGPMVRRGAGDILTLVSMGGIIAMPGSASYAASKAGLRAFQTSVRAELAPHGVRVMGIFPSGVDTPMLRYEATHGGTALNFLSPPQTPDGVADAAMLALRTGRLETYVPYSDSLTARFFAALPWSIEPVLPLFLAPGEKGRRAFLAARGLTVAREE
jgi:short-subunit dehydrogenase